MLQKHVKIAYKAREAIVAVPSTGYGVADYHFVTEDGESWRSGNTVCHAAMSYPRSYAPKKNGQIIAVINRVLKYQISSDIVLAFYEWLLNSSPFAPVFITKDAKDVLDVGASIVDTDQPTNLIMGGLIAGRCLNEHRTMLLLWHDLITRDVNPNVALYFCHAFRKSSEKLTHMGTSHSMLNSNHLDSGVGNFLHGVGKLSKDHWINTETYTYNTNNMWVDKKPIPLTQNVIDGLNNIGKVKDKNNPFAKAKPVDLDDCEQWDYNLALEVIVPILKQVK